ncbi:N-carbamoylputrescine amidase [Ruegeria aquimaris]|uniref:N-carbamoylputrescine amidase n=1 Tax=Ruegeria aquimaris TaxID=2984333 RepID=A0ABT3AM19_9RHOB|nr:N-carbamoylputrescine amidase [Ruegeria sp. XHP0148]MCV2889699.1 N-carbamoylputrescine amidase [Ruegeria sp. XHP0148]
MREVTLAATQMACSWDADENIDKAEKLVIAAAEKGAQIILLQELFETPYFCLEISARFFDLARPITENRAVAHFRALAKKLGVVLPISYFERAGLAHYNALALIDADGGILANYRKTHIPQAAGYEEKYYFTPGDTGFKVVDTKFARLGCGVCWDQWFPETARSLALMGAEVLMFPTAIGSEPHYPDLDSAAHWQRTMQGHAAANIMPLVASNRVGSEKDGDTEMTFYGSSFIADHTGAKVAEANRTDETVLTASFDLDEIASYRRAWGVFRDRRPDMYGALATMDGVNRVVG